MKRKLTNLLIEFYWILELLVLAVVLYLFVQFTDEEAFWAFVRRNNRVVLAALTVGVPSLLSMVIKYYMNNWYILKLKKTLSIADINERILCQEGLLDAYILDQDDHDIPKRVIKSKMQILYTLALGYINIGGYKAALDNFERTLALTVRIKSGVDDLLAEGLALNIASKCEIWSAVALSGLGETDSARQKIEQFTSRIHKLKQVDRATVLMAQTDIAIRSGDVAGARSCHRNLDAEIRDLAAKFNRPDLVYDSVLLDGIIDKLEGKHFSARQKLESVLKHTTSEGNRLRAERELRDC